MKLGYVADLHGRSAHYRRLVELVGQERPRALILGGDQCPLAFQGDSAGQQRAWLRATFRDFLCAVTPLCPVYWNSGNHDLAATRDVLAELAQEYPLHLCDMRRLALDELEIAGFPYGPVSGWPFVDWSLADEGQEAGEHGAPATVMATTDGRLTPVDSATYFAGQPTLAQRRQELVIPNPSTTLLVSHYPPYGSGLDLTASESLIGSRALAAHLLDHPYPLTLHGHVHEAPYLAHHWATQLGPTIACNPGQWGDSLHAVFFEWPAVAQTLTHTIFGRSWRVETGPPAALMLKEQQGLWNSVTR